MCMTIFFAHRHSVTHPHAATKGNLRTLLPQNNCVFYYGIMRLGVFLSPDEAVNLLLDVILD